MYLGVETIEFAYGLQREKDGKWGKKRNLYPNYWRNWLPVTEMGGLKRQFLNFWSNYICVALLYKPGLWYSKFYYDSQEEVWKVPRNFDAEKW